MFPFRRRTPDPRSLVEWRDCGARDRLTIHPTPHTINTPFAQRLAQVVIREDPEAGAQLVASVRPDGGRGETGWVFASNEGPAEGSGGSGGVGTEGKIRAKGEQRASCNISRWGGGMGNEQSSEPWEGDETKVEPGGSKGRERGQSRSRSASPQKKRHQKGASPPQEQQRQQGGVKQHPPENGEEEDEWLQGSAALAIAGGKKKKGKGKKGKGGGGGGKGGSSPEGAAPAATPAAVTPATKPIEDTEAAARRQQQQQQKQPPSTPVPSTPLKAPVVAATAAAAAASPRRVRASGKSVQWGEVVVQTFTRRASQDSVPACGAWPLGLGEEAGEEPVTASLEEYEAARSEEIERRIQELPKRLRKIATGETRQFDYKSSGDRNPIFGPLREQERKQVLLQALLHAHAEGHGAGGHSPGGGGGGGSGHGNQHRQAAALEEQEQLRCLELDDLRASRKRIGCSCHQSKAPEKLSLKKLKEELHRRHLSAPGTDKGKLAELLKQALSEERLCSEHAADKCECFEAGVPCHADVCGCCAHKKGLHATSDGGHKRHLGCHNPVGNFVYKEGAVHGYRGRFLSACSAVDGRPRSCSI